MIFLRVCSNSCFLFHETGIIVGAFSYFRPVIVFMKTVQRQWTTGDLSATPCLLTYVKCTFFMWYALPDVSRGNHLLFICNFVGFLFASIYIVTFLWLSPRVVVLKNVGAIFVAIAISTAHLVLPRAWLHGYERQLLCGLVAAGFSICTCWPSVKIIDSVMKTKNVEFMSFSASISMFLNGSLWFVFGLHGLDPFVMLPNGFTSVLGALQVILYLVYRNNKSEAERKKKIKYNSNDTIMKKNSK
ncbi:PREDICTED: bidirectional sugar transporter SWEET1a-like isoform X3 [Erythranthe guttata]|uniref:bidirectional sugar transporter SWEET1a-like isoform X3 n=1 Tax=Erythranthe guttata TaxID=4155 RepID=UPI00064DF8CA|nr:PREDICTED: bidirectional sugar transporter SWEET1a-like isoform X3 [Erythranthe guttata]|eukprot:XP_012853055.1 PREDICTED: bidirectional sugar transporter SWEET1a-like isoform X3 [Erythranthe guttata]